MDYGLLSYMAAANVARYMMVRSFFAIKPVLLGSNITCLNSSDYWVLNIPFPCSCEYHYFSDFDARSSPNEIKKEVYVFLWVLSSLMGYNGSRVRILGRY